MQPKCLKITEGTAFTPDGVSSSVEMRGSAILNVFATGNPPTILLNQVPGGDIALYILGGRHSIVNWLRLQGMSPIIQTDGDGKGGRQLELRATIWRKHKMLQKDLTLVGIHAHKKIPSQLGGWEQSGTVFLGNQGLDWKDDFAVSPMQLADRLQQTLGI